MAPSWKDVRSYGADDSSQGSKIAILTIAVILMGVGAYFLFFVGRQGNGRENNTQGGGQDDGPTAIVGTSSFRHPALDSIKSGNYQEAADLLEAYLKEKKANRPAALYYLARSRRALGEQDKALKIFNEVRTKYKNTAYAAHSSLEVAKIEASSDPSGALKTLVQTWKRYPTTKPGAEAALKVADAWYKAYVITRKARDKWVPIADAYSTVLKVGVNPSVEERVITRLATLNEYVVYSGDCKVDSQFYEVKRGDLLQVIGRRYKVTYGSIARVNKMNPNNLKVGATLKIMKINSEIIVDRDRKLLDLYVNGRFLKRFLVGIGAAATRTPVGTFEVGSKVKQPPWKGRPYGHPENILGERWIGFKDKAGAHGIGIHGTTDTKTPIQQQESKGCIRMTNKEVEEVYDFIPEQGTTGKPLPIKVTIR